MTRGRSGLGRFVLGLTLLAAAGAVAQTYRAPRDAFGRPDLQGVWDNDSMTRLQRPKGFAALIATPYEAARYEARRFGVYRKAVGPVDPAAPPPEPDKVTDDDRLDTPRGLDRIRGEIRSSQIVDPPDGRLPFRDAARKAAEQALKDEEVYDGPEMRPFDERCMLGGGGGVAAPVINRDHITIVQTRDHVVLQGEMNHEARIVSLRDRRHLPAAMAQWMGDSVGWWEGETLVVETANLSPRDAWRWNSGDWIPLSAGARIVERFTRTSAREIAYAFTVDDPANYTRVWRGEATFRATSAATYEFACHEGNYALGNILRGARAQERLSGSGAPAP